MKYTLEIKLALVKRVISGEPITHVCKYVGLSRHVLYQWVLNYNTYGEKGIDTSKWRCFSAEEKAEAVSMFVEKGIPLSQICLKFRASRSTVKEWIKKSMNKKVNPSAVPPSLSVSICPNMQNKLIKDPKTELERLQNENLLLRAENAYLKKLRALVEERENPEQRKR